MVLFFLSIGQICTLQIAVSTLECVEQQQVEKLRKCYHMYMCEFYVSHILEKLFKDFMLFLRQSAVVSKPCPRASDRLFPLDILRMGLALWTFLLVCVWLGHRVIANHVWVITRSNSVPPKQGVPRNN
jgi:hypothetical protein